MDEGLSNEALSVSVASQGLTHLGLISLSSYLNIHSGSAASHRQEMQPTYSVNTEPGALRQIQIRNLCVSQAHVLSTLPTAS